MSKQTTTYKGKVPFGQKIAFGVGMLANQMFPAVLGIFMVVLVQNLGFPGWMWGVLFFLPRVFDSITDPIMGFISDNTKSKWGRRRQYVLIGSIIMGIAFVAMWQLYGENGVDYNFIYFLLWSFVFYLGLTIFSVPYVAMGYEMTSDFHERTNIMAVAQWIGQWAWVIAPWFWVVMYDPEWFPSPEGATRQLAIWVGVVCAIFAAVPAIFIKSKSTVNENYLPLTIKAIGGSVTEIFNGFKEAFKIKPFRKLCIATFFIFNAFNTVAAFTFFIVVYYLFAGDAAAANAGYWPTLFGSLGALVTTFMVIPTVAWMSKKMEKKKAFLVSQGISILGYILLWFLFIPGKPYMFIFALPFFSFGIGSLFTLMMSMTADVIDLDELNTGKRREGIFGAIYWWMVKFGFAIAGGLSGVILSVIGFDAAAETQTEGAILGLRAFFSGLPIAGTLVAIFVMRNYSVSEARAKEIREALEQKKQAQSTAAYAQGKLAALNNQGYVERNLGIDFKNKSEVELRRLFKTLFTSSKQHGLCFSPYLEGQDTADVLTESQIRRRIDIIAKHTNWVRSFSCTGGNELIPKVAHKKGLKTLVGAWISADKERNKQELESLAKLANQGYVDVAAIGNEVLLRNDLSEQDVLDYIRLARTMLPKHVSITYVDAYYQFIEKPALVNACDVIMINCYPFWEGTKFEDALNALDKMVYLTQQVAQGKKVVVSETGWPSKGQSIQEAQPSLQNAIKYFLNVQKWAFDESVDVFYFSSFDETWKIQQEGELGARWGLWSKDEILKYE